MRGLHWRGLSWSPWPLSAAGAGLPWRSVKRWEPGEDQEHLGCVHPVRHLPLPGLPQDHWHQPDEVNCHHSHVNVDAKNVQMFSLISRLVTRKSNYFPQYFTQKLFLHWRGGRVDLLQDRGAWARPGALEERRRGSSSVGQFSPPHLSSISRYVLKDCESCKVCLFTFEVHQITCHSLSLNFDLGATFHCQLVSSIQRSHSDHWSLGSNMAVDIITSY